MPVFLTYQSTVVAPTGTWTPLNIDISPYRLAAQSTTAASTASMNTPQIANINNLDFATSTVKNAVPSEIFQMVELLQKGYGTANNPVAFWPAAALLRAWLNAIFDGAVATYPTNTQPPNFTA